MAVVMGIDSSTQSVKVEVRDLDTGRLRASAKAPHPAAGTAPRLEQHPSDWWRALIQATRAAALSAAGINEVNAISVAGQQHGMVALDAKAEVIRKAKLWNDTESAADADRLVAEFGAARWAVAAGSVPVAAFTITKLAWLARSEPQAFEQIRTILLPHDYLTWRLTGSFTTDRGDASGTGYWSPSEDCWRPDLLSLIDSSLSESDWLDRLPRVMAPIEPAGKAQPSATLDLGLPQLGGSSPPLVAPGTGDNMAAALGVALAPGDIAISLGTSGTVFAASDVPAADPSGSVAGFADATGHFLPLVCTLNATQVTDTVARLLGVDLATLDHLAASGAPGSGGLVLVPYFDGERTPNRPAATGVLSGLRTDATREQVARAAFEGVVCGLLDGLAALQSAGVTVDQGRVVLVGGGARSPMYRQVVADLCGHPVSIPIGDELVATGACVQAAATLTRSDPLDVANAWSLGAGTIVEPDPTMSADHAAAIRHAYATARG